MPIGAVVVGLAALAHWRADMNDGVQRHNGARRGRVLSQPSPYFSGCGILLLYRVFSKIGPQGGLLFMFVSVCGTSRQPRQIGSGLGEIAGFLCPKIAPHVVKCLLNR